MQVKHIFTVLFLSLVVLASCKKETVTVPDNDAPYYDGIPTSLIQNYVNKAFIDLIGREPLQTEMDTEVTILKEANLSVDARNTLLLKLQKNGDYIPGDSSYSYAYYHRIYELCKVRLMEGASNADIRKAINITKNGAFIDSLLGNWNSYQIKLAKMAKMQNVIDSEYWYHDDSIGISDMMGYMIDNAVYDDINMNSFNYINASFNDLFFRFPTQEEYDNAYLMVEFNQSGLLFQASGSSKSDYVGILSNSREFYEGMVRWAYITLLARDPSTIEVATLMDDFFVDHDLQKVQRLIMVSDEYANF